MNNSELLRIEGLKKYFPVGKGFLSKKKVQLYAVDDVSFSLRQGETLGLVGESGCGKTTLGRCILRLIEPTAGSILFGKTELTGLPPKTMKAMRRDMQIIFQDPYGSLPPRMRLYSILKEPLDLHGVFTTAEKKETVVVMLEKVGLRPEQMNRFPHEFSGGQRQRIAIARSLMLNPRLIIADEPVSALDVSIQAQIINLLVRLQKELDMSYLLISHDLSVVKYMSDRIAVMYLGKICELAKRDDLYRNPLHPYTKALLSAIPVVRPGRSGEKIYLGGEVPSPIHPPPGCRFFPRCSYRMESCDRVEPGLKDIGGDHHVACHLK